jgi:hypothetical protein
MSSSGFTIQSSVSDPNLQLRQDNDTFLMESFFIIEFGLGRVTPPQMLLLVSKVTTLSDIATGNGKQNYKICMASGPGYHATHPP